MEDAERYPFNYDALDKGDVITAEMLVERFGIPTNSDQYARNQVDVCSTIEKELMRRGKLVVAACCKKEIHILEDGDASKHCQKLFDKSRRRMRRAHRKLMEVDRGAIPEDQRKAHDRALVVQGAVLVGVRAGSRGLVYGPTYERNTPGLESYARPVPGGTED